MSHKPLIRVEALTPEHAPQLFGPLSDPQLYQYIPGPPPVSADALAVRFGRLAAGSPDASQSWLNWVLWHEQTPVGTLQSTLRADATAIIAYVLFRSFWGRSFAAENFGFVAKAIQASSGPLSKMPTPFIAHVRSVDGMGHYRRCISVHDVVYTPT